MSEILETAARLDVAYVVEIIGDVDFSSGVITRYREFS